jgi:hypothetical protein
VRTTGPDAAIVVVVRALAVGADVDVLAVDVPELEQAVNRAAIHNPTTGNRTDLGLVRTPAHATASALEQSEQEQQSASPVY